MDEKSGGIFQSKLFWQGWSMAATVAALFAFAANIDYSVDGHAPDYVAIVGDSGGEPLWVVNADLADGVIRVRAGAASAPGDDEVYRLWVARQEDPQQIGVLPVNGDRETFKLNGTVKALLAHGQTLGVSRGPAAMPAEQSEDGDEGSTQVSFDYQATITRL